MHQRLQLTHQLIERLYRLAQILIGLGVGIVLLQRALQLLQAVVQGRRQLLGRALTGKLVQIGTHGTDALEGLIQRGQGAVDLRQRLGRVHVDELVEDLVHLALDLVQPGLNGREHLIAGQLDGLILGCIRIEVQIHHLAPGQQAGGLERRPQPFLELLAEQGTPLLLLSIGIAVREPLHLDARQYRYLSALEHLYPFLVDEVGGRDDGADPDAAIFHRRPRMQATDTVFKQKHVIDELIQTTGKHTGFILEECETIHLLDRLTGGPAGRQPHCDATVEQTLQRIHLHLHPLAAHGDLETRGHPEAGVGAHQHVIGGVDEDLVLHLALLGQEFRLFHLAYGKALIVDGRPHPERTGIPAAQGEPQPLGILGGQWRLVQHGVFVKRLALSARRQLDIGTGEQSAETGDPFPANPGLDHPELTVFLEHAGSSVGQASLQHRMAVILTEFHCLDTTHFHLAGADHRLARHYPFGGSHCQGEAGTLRIPMLEQHPDPDEQRQQRHHPDCGGRAQKIRAGFPPFLTLTHVRALLVVNPRSGGSRNSWQLPW